MLSALATDPSSVHWQRAGPGVARLLARAAIAASMAVASAMGRQRAGATRCSGQHGHGHRRRPVGKGVHAAKSMFVCLFVCLFVCRQCQWIGLTPAWPHTHRQHNHTESLLNLSTLTSIHPLCSFHRRNAVRDVGTSPSEEQNRTDARCEMVSCIVSKFMSPSLILYVHFWDGKLRDCTDSARATRRSAAGPLPGFARCGRPTRVDLRGWQGAVGPPHIYTYASGSLHAPWSCGTRIHGILRFQHQRAAGTCVV
jgi:hypothetical protein